MSHISLEEKNNCKKKGDGGKIIEATREGREDGKREKSGSGRDRWVAEEDEDWRGRKLAPFYRRSTAKKTERHGCLTVAGKFSNEGEEGTRRLLSPVPVFPLSFAIIPLPETSSPEGKVEANGKRKEDIVGGGGEISGRR